MVSTFFLAGRWNSCKQQKCIYPKLALSKNMKTHFKMNCNIYCQPYTASASSDWCDSQDFLDRQKLKSAHLFFKVTSLHSSWISSTWLLIFKRLLSSHSDHWHLSVTCSLLQCVKTATLQHEFHFGEEDEWWVLCDCSGLEIPASQMTVSGITTAGTTVPPTPPPTDASGWLRRTRCWQSDPRGQIHSWLNMEGKKKRACVW